MFTRINKKNLNSEISHQMISKILTGILKPGEKLPPEREMSEQMNVNRNTLREALRKLEILGLLSVRQGDGIYVLDYRDSGNLELLKFVLFTRKDRTAEIIYDIVKIRTYVFPEMAAIAASRITDEEINYLQKISNDEYDSLLEKDIIFHAFIARTSGNLFFMMLLNFFNDIYRHFGYLYFSFEENKAMTRKFHKNITDALIRKDSKKAKSIMHDILVYTEERIVDYLERTNEKN